MIDLLSNYYYIYKTVHVVCVIIWMGGMMILSLLFSIHAQYLSGQQKNYQNKSSNEEIDNKKSIRYERDDSKMLVAIEKQILSIITPAMILGSTLGFVNAYIYGFEVLGMWFWIKMIIVLIIWSLHGLFISTYKKIASGRMIFSAKFYQMISVLIALNIIIAVSMVIMKPFD